MTGVASDSTGTSCSASTLRVGMWDDQEHCRFLRGVVRFGKEWREVREVIGSRREKQIQSHFQKYVRKIARMVKKIKRKGSHFHYQDQLLEAERALYARLFTYNDLTPATPSQLRSMIICVCAPDTLPDPARLRPNIIIKSCSQQPLRQTPPPAPFSFIASMNMTEDSQGLHSTLGETGEPWSPNPNSFFIAFTEDDRKQQLDNSTETFKRRSLRVRPKNINTYTLADFFPGNGEWLSGE